MDNMVIAPVYPTPGVYYIHQESERFSLVYRYDKFLLPERMYGNVLDIASRIWIDFATANGNRGVMFTGKPGSGKSKTSELLCNIAIEKGLPVIIVVEVTPSVNLIRFLSTLSDCVLFFDEFKKNMKEYEENMLTMLTANSSTKRLTIITENEQFSISPYILNRPERVRYHINANKIDYSVLMDYLSDYPVTERFRADLLQIYNNKDLSFDQLQALVSEHLRYPEDSMSTLLGLLNLSALQICRTLNVDKVIDTNTGDILVGNLSWLMGSLDFIERNKQDLVVNAKKQDTPENPPNPVITLKIPYSQLEPIDSLRYKAIADHEDKQYLIYFTVRMS